MKPLTAAEVYKNEEKSPMPVQFTTGKIKKKKKTQKLIKKKTLKKAAITSLELPESQNLETVKVKKIGKKVVPKATKIQNGVECNGVKKKKKKLNKSLENGELAINETSLPVDKKVENGLKKKKKRSDKLEKKGAKKTKKSQSDLKKKIREVKKLVKEGKKNPQHLVSLSSSEGSESEDGEMTFSITAFSGKQIKAVNCEDSRTQGQENFQWIISPYSETDFFNNFWEKGPLLVKRNNRDYYKGLFSCKDLDKILHEQVVLYTKNIDITSYSNGVRETHNPVGQAHAPVVWDYYNNGCSIRMLNPQTFHPRVWKCLSFLQEYFNSFCGANMYLTPPDTQGFAPHWDDIEAFILQLEGKKRWRVYKPRSDDEVLPDYSSPNFKDEDIGSPVLDTVLEAGDLLYFPRGYIHQGQTLADEHSLHITISTYQKNSWGHYLEKLLPHALSVAMNEDVEFRRGLPRGYLNYMGIVHMENESEERTAFKKKVCDLVTRMLDSAPYDAAVDQRGTAFMHDCLPPYLTQEDKECSVYGGGEKWCAKKKKVINRVELQPDTPVRLIRGNCIRLVAEEESVHIYHCMENSREYHRDEPQFLEVSMENAPAIETLIHTYPSYVPIESLPLQDDGEKMTIASGLWERGLLVSAHPLDAQYDD